MSAKQLHPVSAVRADAPVVDPIAWSVGLAEGTIVDGRYRTGRMIGRGAMGAVFEATHLELGERVAIKMLLRDHLGSPEIVARFSREAKAAVKLKGEHVARVLDVGKHEGLVPYIIMEYLDGEDLGHLMETNGPLQIEDACAYAIEACAGLAEAHARGIIHRDVKPENLFLTRLADGRQRVKILDFGVSKVALTGSSLDEADLAATSTMLGSPLYMSPEQVRSKEVDHRSDIWSLGVALYELLAGRTPFHSGSIAELVARVLEEPPPPLRSLRADVPEALEATINRCLLRDPEARWESVASLAVALLPFAPRASRTVVEQARSLVLRASDSASVSRVALPPVIPPSVFPPAGPGDVSASASSPSLAASTPGRASGIAPAASYPLGAAGALAPAPAPAPEGKRAPWPAVVAGALLLLAVAGGFYALGRRPDGGAAPPATTTLPAAPGSAAVAVPSGVAGPTGAVVAAQIDPSASGAAPPVPPTATPSAAAAPAPSPAAPSAVPPSPTVPADAGTGSSPRVAAKNPGTHGRTGQGGTVAAPAVVHDDIRLTR